MTDHYKIGQDGITVESPGTLAAEIVAHTDLLIEILKRHGVSHMEGVKIADFDIQGGLMSCGCPLHIITARLTTRVHSHRLSDGGLRRFMDEHESGTIDSGALPKPT